jgi:hypothetical protein
MAANEHMNGISASVVPGGRAPRGARRMIVAAVWSAALVGGVLGVTTLTGRDTPAPAPAPHVGEQFNAPRLGGRVVTSFGSLTVSAVEGLTGPTSAMHLDPVPRGMRPIQLNMTINNLQQRSLKFSPGWFKLVGARGSYSIGWTTRLSTMAPLSARQVLMRVAVPAGDALPSLEFRDPAGRAPVRIELGRAKRIQIFNPATHQHGG